MGLYRRVEFADPSANLTLMTATIVSGHFKTGQCWPLQNQPP
jgi:hypothetical protein